MDIEKDPETNHQGGRIILVVGLLASGLVCCCIVGLGLYFGFLLARSPGIFGPRPTPTLISLKEINSASPLGKFYFGLDGVDDSCRVTRQTDKFSQEELLRSGYIYATASFGSEYEGKSIDWSVYTARGVPVEVGKVRPITLNSDQKNCLTVYLLPDPRMQTGTYVLEVKFEGQLAFRKVFSLSASDLDKIPRPTRKPLGDFNIGRGIDTSTCIPTDWSSAYPLSGLKDNPWFYLASPFQFGDLGKTIYWSVRDSRGRMVFDRQKRRVIDKIDLCFWQGFSMDGSPAGVYTVVVENERFVVIYRKDFELR